MSEPWVLVESKEMPGSYEVRSNGRLIGRAARWAETKWSAQYVASDLARSHLQSALPSPEAVAEVVWAHHMGVQAKLDRGCTVRSAADPTHCGIWCSDPRCQDPWEPCEPFGTVAGEVAWADRDRDFEDVA